MKIFGAIAMAGLFALSCSKMNELPKFDDKDAFVAFVNTSLTVNEDVGIVLIPVVLASAQGLSTTISFKTIDGSAISGVDYQVVGSNSVAFTPDEPIQYIQIQIFSQIGVFTGDLSFSIALESQSVHLGAEKRITVTISDLDHPLTPILGSYTATGESGFDGPTTWTITIGKDPGDVNKVWLTDLVASGGSIPIYGIVDDEMTEIHIPVNQILSTSYPLVRLEGFYGPDGDDDILDGGYITIVISEDKKSMTIMDWIVSAVYGDAEGSDFLGWFNYFEPDVILVKD